MGFTASDGIGGRSIHLVSILSRTARHVSAGVSNIRHRVDLVDRLGAGVVRSRCPSPISLVPLQQRPQKRRAGGNVFLRVEDVLDSAFNWFSIESRV